ncbi:MAG: leucine-rich repeat protein [Eubacteriales bacterium]|nr:leucine-rich repeat protein [Eubacteriales bacterium]
MPGLEERLHQYEPLFGGWYLRGEIGSGSYGRVYRAEYRDLFGTVETAAIKAVEILPDHALATTPDKLKQLAYEAAMSEVETLRCLRGLSNVVNMDDHAVFEIVEDGRVIGYDLVIRMELLQNVGQMIRRNGGRLQSVEQAKQLGKDICCGLIRCHACDILHRDINPNNIFQNAFGDYKLGDFGIAKQLHGTLHAQTAIGTKQYVAPEVFHRANSERLADRYDARVDIYCLGLVLYQLTNDGYLPFYYEGLPRSAWEEAVMRRLNGEKLTPPSQADDAFSQVILKACAYRPEDRFASAQEMYDALCRIDQPQQTAVIAEPQQELDFWHPQEQKKSLLHAFGLEVVSTPEMRHMAQKLDARVLESDHMQLGGALTPRAAARLPRWRIRAPWFHMNHLRIREYTSISDRAFQGRRDLVSVNISGTMTEIGKEAFAHCGSLTEFRCGDGLKRIGQRAFADDAKLTRCHLPDSVCELGDQVWMGCTSLQSLRLPEQIQALGEELCAGCMSLYQVTLPSHLRSIGTNAFHASGLQKILMPDSCIRLGAGAFSDCKQLRSVQLSLRLAIISEACFAGCTALQQFDFPFRLAEIRDRAFYGCTSLTELVIPEGVRRIGEQAFAHCDSLQTIRVPDSVRQIGESAFPIKGKRHFGGSRFTVIAKEDSYAWRYCRQNRIEVRER